MECYICVIVDSAAAVVRVAAAVPEGPAAPAALGLAAREAPAVWGPVMTSAPV